MYPYRTRTAIMDGVAGHAPALPRAEGVEVRGTPTFRNHRPTLGWAKVNASDYRDVRAAQREQWDDETTSRHRPGVIVGYERIPTNTFLASTARGYHHRRQRARPWRGDPCRSCPSNAIRPREPTSEPNLRTALPEGVEFTPQDSASCRSVTRSQACKVCGHRAAVLAARTLRYLEKTSTRTRCASRWRDDQSAGHVPRPRDRMGHKNDEEMRAARPLRRHRVTALGAGRSRSRPLRGVPVWTA